MMFEHRLRARQVDHHMAEIKCLLAKDGSAPIKWMHDPPPVTRENAELAAWVDRVQHDAMKAQCSRTS